MLIRTALSLGMGFAALAQPRPVPYKMVWDQDAVVSLAQDPCFLERSVNGKLSRQDLTKPPGTFGVDHQEGWLWVNQLLPEDPDGVLPIRVARYAPDQPPVEVGTFRSPLLRGVLIMPLRNGKFIGFVQNLQFDHALARSEPIAPIVYLTATPKGEFILTGWGDLGLEKPYYAKPGPPGAKRFNYPCLEPDVSMDPCPLRAGDSIILPSFTTGLLFVFSATDGSYKRTVDVFRIGEGRLQEPFHGAALVLALPTREGSVLLLHRATVSAGALPVPDGDLARSMAAWAENTRNDPQTIWTLVDPATGERSPYSDPQPLGKPLIGTLERTFKLRFNALGHLQEAEPRTPPTPGPEPPSGAPADPAPSTQAPGNRP